MKQRLPCSASVSYTHLDVYKRQVVKYDDLAAGGYSMANVKAKGLQRTEGKEYVVQDGDIIEFLFNV